MKTLIWRLVATLAASIASATLIGCAVNHSDNFVSLVMTKDVSAPATPIHGMAILLVQGSFGDTTDKGKFLPGLSMEAQRKVSTLYAALRVQLPATFGRNGIDVKIVSDTKLPDDAAVPDYLLTLRPTQAGYLPGKPVEITLGGEIHDRDGRLVWRGTALERVKEKSDQQAEMAKWSDAMAEDVARTLLSRWRRDGLVKLGPSGDSEPI
jgi:hypothetical protein